MEGIEIGLRERERGRKGGRERNGGEREREREERDKDGRKGEERGDRECGVNETEVSSIPCSSSLILRENLLWSASNLTITMAMNTTFRKPHPQNIICNTKRN